MCICVPWAMAPTRWNDRRPLRTQPQRADAPGQPDVLPAGLAFRQKQGRAGAIAHRGPGHPALPPCVCRCHHLAWLGLAADGPQLPVYQSERAEIYQHYYDILDRRGLVYPCFCSRSQLHAASAPHRSDGQVVYAGTCRGLTPAEVAERCKIRVPAWRVQVPDETISFTDGHMGMYEENLARDCGDFYLRRADGAFAYQLAVVVDDALMGVTEVVRGSDLLSSTPRQLWLYRELGLTPPTFYHLPLLLASDGRRLSKRDGDQSLENLRARYSAEEIIGKLAFACGLQATPRPVTPQELAADFDWAKVPKNDIVLPESMF